MAKADHSSWPSQVFALLSKWTTCVFVCFWQRWNIFSVINFHLHLSCLLYIFVQKKDEWEIFTSTGNRKVSLCKAISWCRIVLPLVNTAWHTSWRNLTLGYQNIPNIPHCFGLTALLLSRLSWDYYIISFTMCNYI